ncbi:MAG: site-specific integrase [Thermomicrobiales bacterium]|nr:site-specific integrase [Thermomicrobiales bacterium]
MARGSVKARPMQDGTVRYRIKWESRGPDGKRRYHSATRATKKEAEAFLSSKLQEVNEGTFVIASKETVAQYLERWLEASAPGWSEATCMQYGAIVRARIVPHLGALPLSRLDALTIQTAYATLTAAGYAPESIRVTHTVLHAALGRAVAWRLLPHNPADGVTPPSIPVAAPAAWSATEAAAFLTHRPADRFAPLWRLGLDSGMRLGELLALGWRDVDLARGVVSVRRTLTRTAAPGQGSWKIGEIAKTASSRRSIVIGPTTVAALRSHRARQAERKLAAGAAWLDMGLVFDRGDGHWLAPCVPRRAFERAVAASGVSPLTPHGMRHTMATLLLTAGVHPKIVQERLGHRSIQMTLDRYSHVTMTMQEDAAASLDALLGGEARPRRGQDAS